MRNYNYIIMYNKIINNELFIYNNIINYDIKEFGY